VIYREMPRVFGGIPKKKKQSQDKESSEAPPPLLLYENTEYSNNNNNIEQTSHSNKSSSNDLVMLYEQTEVETKKTFTQEEEEEDDEDLLQLQDITSEKVELPVMSQRKHTPPPSPKTKSLLGKLDAESPSLNTSSFLESKSFATQPTQVEEEEEEDNDDEEKEITKNNKDKVETQTQLEEENQIEIEKIEKNYLPPPPPLLPAFSPPGKEHVQEISQCSPGIIDPVVSVSTSSNTKEEAEESSSSVSSAQLVDKSQSQFSVNDKYSPKRPSSPTAVIVNSSADDSDLFPKSASSQTAVRRDIFAKSTSKVILETPPAESLTDSPSSLVVSKFVQDFVEAKKDEEGEQKTEETLSEVHESDDDDDDDESDGTSDRKKEKIMLDNKTPENIEGMSQIMPPIPNSDDEDDESDEEEFDDDDVTLTSKRQNKNESSHLNEVPSLNEVPVSNESSPVNEIPASNQVAALNEDVRSTQPPPSSKPFTLTKPFNKSPTPTKTFDKPTTPTKTFDKPLSSKKSSNKRINQKKNTSSLFKTTPSKISKRDHFMTNLSPRQRQLLNMEARRQKRKVTAKKPILRPRFKTDERVEALWNGGKDKSFQGYYIGTIGERRKKKKRSDTSYTIVFDDGTIQNNVLEEHVRPTRPQSGIYEMGCIDASSSDLTTKLRFELNFLSMGEIQGIGHRRDGEDETMDDQMVVGQWYKNVKRCRVRVHFTWSEMMFRGYMDGLGQSTGEWYVLLSLSLSLTHTHTHAHTQQQQQNTGSIKVMKIEFEVNGA